MGVSSRRKGLAVWNGLKGPGKWWRESAHWMWQHGSSRWWWERGIQCSGGGGNLTGVSPRIGSDGEMRECTQLFVILALKREASAGGEYHVKGEVFLFPCNKRDSRVYLNAYGHDSVRGRVLVVWLIMFDWKKKEGHAGRLCCLLYVEFVLGIMLSVWHSTWLIFTVTPWSWYDYLYFTDEKTGVK